MASALFRKKKNIIKYLVDKNGRLPYLEEIIKIMTIHGHNIIEEHSTKATSQINGKREIITQNKVIMKEEKNVRAIRKKRKHSQPNSRLTLELIFMDTMKYDIRKKGNRVETGKEEINKSENIVKKHEPEESTEILTINDNEIKMPTKRIRDTQIQSQFQRNVNLEKNELIIPEHKTNEYSLIPPTQSSTIKTINVSTREDITQSIRVLKEEIFERRRISKNFRVLKTIRPYKIEDSPEVFRKMFLYRYKKLRNIILRSISNVAYAENNGNLIVIIVRDVIRKNNFGIIIGEYITEDERILESMFIVNFQQNDLMMKFHHVIPDIVIGVIVSKIGQDKFIVRDIIFPDVPRSRKRKFAEHDVNILFLSDIHLGSKKFLDKLFLSFLKFVSGDDANTRRIAEQIEYIVILGDVVDGVGVYPDQKNELAIANIYDQYAKIAELLEEIPQDIKIIIIPGNHDAAGNFIPQPPIPKEIAEPLYELKNVEMLSNPSLVEIEGVKLLLYHGHGLERLASSLHMDINPPTRIVSEMLRYRHIVPTWGSVPIAPLSEDYLIIDEVPDIIAMGHIHIFDQRISRGNILTIVPGAFQDITSWQIKLGIKPTPGVFGLVNLKDFKLRVIRFTEKSIYIQ